MSHPRVFSYILSFTSSSSLLFVHIIRKFTWPESLVSLPLYRACLPSNREKVRVQNFLQVSFPRVHWRRTVELVYLRPTTHSIILGGAAQAAFFAVTLYVDFFVSGFNLDPHEHTSYLLIHYLSCTSYNYMNYRIDIPKIFSMLISIYISGKYRKLYQEF